MSGHREQMSVGGFDSSPSLLQGRRFYCREWALEKLRRCLDARSVPAQPPGLLVMGGPGAGKTALCTEAVWPASKAGLAAGLAPRCLASHFCQREDQRSTVLWRFVLGLVEQLRASPLLPPGYGEILGSPSVSSALEPVACQGDPDNAFKRAVLRPLLDLPPPARTLMVVVDSLDVGYGPAGTGSVKSGSIAELLAANQHLLPGWLLLVCSVRRHNKAVCKMFSGFRKLCLDDLRKPPPVHDVQQYILCRLDEEAALRRQLTPDTADMLNLLHIKSGGCFLFLERVLDGVSASLVGLREIRDIPGTLNGLYLWLCQRLFPRGLFVYVRPLLNVLLAAPRPLTPQQLFTAVWTHDTSLSPQDFQNKLRTLSPLLIDGPGGTKLLFHASFAEWLTDVKYCTQKYLCSRTVGHSMLAMALTLQGQHLDIEDTCQLATHLVCSGHHKDNPSLLALWMLWAGLPALTPSRSHALTASLSQPPVLVSQEVLQLLMRTGLISEACCTDADPSVGVHCVAVEGTSLQQAHEREVSVKKLLDRGVSMNQLHSKDGQTLLAGAAHEGSADVVELLLARGSDPLISDHQGQTPLSLASRQGHVKVLSVLLEWAKNQEPVTAARMMEHVDSEGWTALRSAAWGGHGEAVRLLLDAGADVDGCDNEGRTALRAAAWGGHEEIVLTLLDYGAQVDKADSNGRTPLIAAAYMGHHEAVEILLDHNADVDLADGDGRTALSVAALCVPTAAGIKGYGEVASLLLERGADPGHRDHDGMTPLLLAAYEGHDEVVELLLEAGADVDETAGPDGNVSAAAAVTPLLAAAAMGHMKTVSRLLFWGAAVDAIDCEGRTALCLAAARGSGEVVRALLDRGLDENHKDDLGWTPLHAAACEGQRAVCAALTERGSMARVGEMDIEGRTPLILAAQEGHWSTVRLLLDRRSPIDHRAYDGHSALSAALLEGHAEVAELLMRRGADTDVRDAEGRPLLYLLVLEGRLEMATLLIEKGGVPLESRDSEGRTALHVASWQGSVEMVDLLLKHGANPNAQDTEGRPPMHSVAWTGHAEVGRRLLDTRNVLIDLACHQGATSLSIAAQEGHTNIVEMLLERAANPDHVDKYGRSPVKVAGKQGHFSVVRLLESFGAKPYLGPSPNSSTVSPAKPKRILSSGISGSNGGEVTATTSSSSVSSPASTAERFHSIQSSQTSSTCHSLATVQTAPADSLRFIQQIQQHSLPRSRSRHSTLPPPGSLHGSVQRQPKGSPPPTVCTVTALVHDCSLPQKGLSPSLEYHDKMNKQNSHLINTDRTSYAGGKWHSVMASLGIRPGQDSPAVGSKNRASPPLGYPYRLQSPLQGDVWDSLPQKNILLPAGYSFTPGSPCSALPEDVMVTMTTTDPQLNLKQAIKLQFEGPTSAALYKRETPL
ncbi:ankyrin repeat domain-containing protein 50 isoform X1 [Scophthalmus maximus]|uniref:ankyrin repeat domain-containing protein 50 isoform X1 n=2 Tax=Scophthalmus maximus TaxID=52904 RepID=UPI001FA87C99|nr:ankyrin repeat domain-containing protein 50 isoform X1 [Scophthalmus maximus]XP_035507385.2 ankyrin repeat domain-containing protein 50 isoform X1 [Scophthalmus maximus]XP_035507386.2 ankyrin repeat domain-containing protein 50 isoform X1 [Scophthalmus maximus]XP_035507387.2 ankyrin repeat domain-containing protein 50 isoform X1 [Scophthalmus maximus]XP_035507388.2 ankyrin repeat domain-containing protein 50 isoform X1 [Scophthalmus maximus]XP_035507389.2 ankyrin repeat domain-containing pr